MAACAVGDDSRGTAGVRSRFGMRRAALMTLAMFLLVGVAAGSYWLGREDSKMETPDASATTSTWYVPEPITAPQTTSGIYSRFFEDQEERNAELRAAEARRQAQELEEEAEQQRRAIQQQERRLNELERKQGCEQRARYLGSDPSYC